MVSFGYITEGSARAMARTIRRVDGLVPSLTTEEAIAASDVVVIPVRLSNGNDGTYDGVEQVWDTTAEEWTAAGGGITWDASSDAGQLVEVNKRTNLDGSVFFASYFGDNDDEVFWSFFAGFGGTDETISFRHYLDGSDLRFYDGTVWVNEADGVVVSDNGSGYSLSSDAIYYVETSTPYDSQDTAVTSTIQSSSMTEFLADDGSNVTTKTALLEVVNGVPIPMYEGDIYFQKLFTPEFHVDIQGSLVKSAKTMMEKDHTNSSDALDGYFLEGRVTQLTYQAGELSDQSDVEEFKFGGVIDNNAIPYVSTIDTSTEDQITFNKKELTPDIKLGLVEEWDNLADGAEVIEANDWIGIEKGGIFYHKNSPADSTTSDDHWKAFGWDGTNMTVDGTSVTSLEIYVDRKGHIWEIDGESQPPDSTNYRYEHCTNPASFPDLIFDTSQANNTIFTGGECYYEIGTTDQAATSPAPTVEETYADCQTCLDATTNELWLDCTTDATLAVLSPSHTAVDYAWLCDGGVYKKAYNSGNTLAAATDPTVLEQCDNPAPADCTDLIGWPGSDNFGGIGCNSALVGGTNWGIRWTSQNTEGTASITGGKLRYVVDSGDPKLLSYSNNADLTGDFTAIVRVDMVTFSTNTSTSQGANFRVHQGGTLIAQIWINKAPASASNQWSIVTAANNPLNSETSTWANDYVYFRAVRSGTTITFSYSSDGISWNVSTNTKTGVSGTLQIWPLGVSRWTGGNLTMDWDDLSIVDGASSEIYIDPTGDACI